MWRGSVAAMRRLALLSSTLMVETLPHLVKLLRSEDEAVQRCATKAMHMITDAIPEHVAEAMLPMVTELLEEDAYYRNSLSMCLLKLAAACPALAAEAVPLLVDIILY